MKVKCPMNTLKDEHKYDDIINLPHATSAKHPRMDLIDRAAQFSPFAALTGYDAAIKETGRLTDRRIELDENEKAILNEKIQIIMEANDEKVEVTFTFYQPDERKEGGAYVTVTGKVKKLDVYERAIILTDSTHIPIDDIYEIESDILTSL